MDFCLFLLVVIVIVSFTVELSDGLVVYKPEHQLLVYIHRNLDIAEHRIVVKRNNIL